MTAPAIGFDAEAAAPVSFRAHLAGFGNLFANGALKVTRSAGGRFLIAVDSGLDAIAIELSPEGAESLRHQLGAGTVITQDAGAGLGIDLAAPGMRGPEERAAA
jgi:hypothetical protein